MIICNFEEGSFETLFTQLVERLVRLFISTFRVRFTWEIYQIQRRTIHNSKKILHEATHRIGLLLNSKLWIVKLNNCQVKSETARNFAKIQQQCIFTCDPKFENSNKVPKKRKSVYDSDFVRLWVDSCYSDRLILKEN
jgi:hypothetical protein